MIKWIKAKDIKNCTFEGGKIKIDTKENALLFPLEEVGEAWSIESIKVPEHYGTWYTIDCVVVEKFLYFLCEHEEFGDETPNIIINQEGQLILDEVYNGFEDLADFLNLEIIID